MSLRRRLERLKDYTEASTAPLSGKVIIYQAVEDPPALADVQDFPEQVIYYLPDNGRDPGLTR